MTTASPDFAAEVAPADRAGRWLGWFCVALFLAALAVNVGYVTVGWSVNGMLGQEFRQTQTADTAYWMQQTGFKLAYETPVLGKPWSAPMEFPLYQWLAGTVATRTGLSLAVAGRWVSAVSFYAMLPALGLLLGQCGVPRLRRGLVLVPVLVCPIYIFYTRAFLIESLALAAAFWHVYFVVEALRGRRLALAIPLALVTGVVAVLVKATTWSVCLMPAFVYGCLLLWRSGPWCRGGSWGRLTGLVLVAALVTLPVLGTGLWWVHFADTIKAQNPTARFLLSASLTGFNFGTVAMRLSLHFWQTIGTTCVKFIAPEFALAGLVLGLGVVGGRWRGPAALAGVAFFGALLTYSNLYLLHDYYFYANAVFLCLALGLALLQVLEARFIPIWARIGVALAVPAAQFHTYSQDYLQQQRVDYTGGSGLTQAIAALTDPGDVIVIYGDDWASMIPYYAQRRALMVPGWLENDEPRQQEAFALLKDEHIPFLLMKDYTRFNRQLIDRRIADFKLHPAPLFTWNDRVDVYVREDLLDTLVTNMENGAFHAVELKIHRSPQRPFVLDLALHPVDPVRQRLALSVFSPIPFKYKAPYGLSLMGYRDANVVLAHTPSEFHIHLPGAAKNLKLVYGMTDDSWAKGDTDGVDWEIVRVAPDGTTTSLWKVFLDPKFTPADRGRKTLALPLPPGGGDLILRTGPGPTGNGAYDWAYIESLQIR